MKFSHVIPQKRLWSARMYLHFPGMKSHLLADWGWYERKGKLVGAESGVEVSIAPGGSARTAMGSAFLKAAVSGRLVSVSVTGTTRERCLDLNSRSGESRGKS